MQLTLLFQLHTSMRHNPLLNVMPLSMQLTTSVCKACAACLVALAIMYVFPRVHWLAKPGKEPGSQSCCARCNMQKQLLLRSSERRHADWPTSVVHQHLAYHGWHALLTYSDNETLHNLQRVLCVSPRLSIPGYTGGVNSNLVALILLRVSMSAEKEWYVAKLSSCCLFSVVAIEQHCWAQAAKVWAVVNSVGSGQ